MNLRLSSIIGLAGCKTIMALAAGALMLCVASVAASSDAAVKESPQTTAQNGGDSKLIVYYFHTTDRCYSCNLIEKFTKETLVSYFQKEIADGLIDVQIVNVERPENNHFIKDYKLYTKSVIVSDVVKGNEIHWKNLTRVWELIRKESSFRDYVSREVRLCLEDHKG
ncbi:MAG: hypothetical protein JW884_00710 [Deltaproteobacteria bacterium]|nr:hypothetical protein [Deltaproteobacteria bacterium]